MAKPRMEGTHKPIKRAPSFSPRNHMVSEKIRHENASESIIKSVLLSFFSIFSLFLKLFASSVTNLESEGLDIFLKEKF